MPIATLQLDDNTTIAFYDECHQGIRNYGTQNIDIDTLKKSIRGLSQIVKEVDNELSFRKIPDELTIEFSASISAKFGFVFGGAKGSGALKIVAKWLNTADAKNN